MISILPFIAASALFAPAQEADSAPRAPKDAPPAGQSASTVQEPEEVVFVPPAEAPDAVEGGVFTRFFHDDGTLAREGYLKDGARTGVWKAWFPNGKRALHGAYQDYARVGSWVIYAEDGKSYTQATYDMEGARDGIWKTYFAAPGSAQSVKAVEGWRHGRKHGSHERYTPKGKLVSLVEFHDGLKHGKSVKFSRGAKHQLEEGQYAMGKQVGPWKIFDGKGTIQSEGPFVDGLRSGEWIEYHSNGNRKSVGGFADGLPEGPWQGFYKQGERRYRGTFEKGTLSGEYVEWWPSGDKKGEGVFKEGRYDGRWTFWDREGREDPSTSGVYRDGDLVR